MAMDRVVAAVVWDCSLRFEEYRARGSMIEFRNRQSRGYLSSFG
jgi:hypothetical protein